MSEPPKLVAARAHLAQAEALHRSDDGLFHLEEGLALLDEVMTSGPVAFQSVARNLATTYANRLCTTIRRQVEADRGMPEPQLERLFKFMLAFDERGFELPPDARAAKISLARRLIDRYYEGYSAEAKERALEQLAGIVGKPAK